VALENFGTSYAYGYVSDTFSKSFIACIGTSDGMRYYSFPYTVSRVSDGGEIALGEPVEMEKTYVPADGLDAGTLAVKANQIRGQLLDLHEAMKGLYRRRPVKKKKMGSTPTDKARENRAYKAIQEAVDVFTEVSGALSGLLGELNMGGVATDPQTGTPHGDSLTRGLELLSLWATTQELQPAVDSSTSESVGVQGAA